MSGFTRWTIAVFLAGSLAEREAAAQPQPGARLLISGPEIPYGQSWNEIHQFDLVTQERTTFRAFQERPGPIAIGPDGAVYVLVDAEERAYKLNPVTGDTVEVLDIPLAPFDIFRGVAVKADGNLLVARDAWGSGQIDEYGPDGTHQRVWLGSSPYLVSDGLKLTPNGKVALLCCGSIGVGEPNELVEYDLDGNNPRVVIDSTMGVRMYSFEFVSAAEVLVMHAGSDPSQYRIKRYDWTTTPGTFLGDLIVPPPNIPLWIARNAQDGSIYGPAAAAPYAGCVYGWASDGTPLNAGQPFATCYGGFIYFYGILVVNDCGALQDCNGNFVSDDCDIASGTSQDCNDNGVPDECDIAAGTSQDCQPNGVPDECDVLPPETTCCEAHPESGCDSASIEACVCLIDPYCCEVAWDRTCVDEVTSEGCGICDNDCNTNNVPDDCEPDFDVDALIDDCDPDIDNDGVPNEQDVCDYTPWSAIQNGRVILDPGDPLYGTIRGDLDGDCDCDLEDYAIVQQDFTGPNG